MSGAQIMRRLRPVPGKYETTEADISSTEQRASGIASTNLQHHDLSIHGR